MRKWYRILDMDPSKPSAAKWGFDRHATEQYGCTHCLRVYAGDKLIFEGMFKGESAVQMDADIWRDLGYVEEKP